MKLLVKIIAVAQLSIIPSLVPISVSAESNFKICPSGGTSSLQGITEDDACASTPTKYSVSIYEMGLCILNPYQGNKFSKENGDCTSTVSAETAQLVNLAAGSAVTLKNTCIEEASLCVPKSGTYQYAYAVLDETFTLNSQYVVDGITYYSDSTTMRPSGRGIKNATTTGPNDFKVILDNFGEGEFVDEDNPEDVAFENIATDTLVDGQMTALLTSQDLSMAQNTSQVKRIIGIFKPSKPFVVTAETTGLEVKFKISNQGSLVYSCADFIDMEDSSDEEIASAYKKVCEFNAGPFSVSLQPF